MITGCGRSGTLYASQLFDRVGISCAHEQVFGPLAMKTGRLSKVRRNRQGEASWIAAGILPDRHSPIPDLSIIHLVRNPVAVIRSMMGVGSFSRRSNYRKFIYEKLPHLKTMPPLHACCEFWCDWNRRTSKLRRDYELCRVKVEQLSDDAANLEWLAGSLGYTVSRSDISEAIRALGTTVHGRSRDEGVCWDTLPRGLRDQVRDLAEVYGYSQEELENA